MFESEDDVVVIALWIIAIGFVILAIDKTTKLNDSSNNAAQILQQLPSPDQSQQQSIQNHTAEDQQYYQIQQQLRQMGNRLSELKRHLSQ